MLQGNTVPCQGSAVPQGNAVLCQGNAMPQGNTVPCCREEPRCGNTAPCHAVPGKVWSSEAASGSSALCLSPLGPSLQVCHAGFVPVKEVPAKGGDEAGGQDGSVIPRGCPALCVSHQRAPLPAELLVGAVSGTCPGTGASWPGRAAVPDVPWLCCRGCAAGLCRAWRALGVGVGSACDPAGRVRVASASMCCQALRPCCSAQGVPGALCLPVTAALMSRWLLHLRVSWFGGTRVQGTSW